MKLEVGMYVRKKNGRLGKIIEVAEYYYLLDIKNSNFEVKCEEKHIKKASHNIIDLIEVGDYVNGYKVIDITDYVTVDLRVPTGDSWGYREYSEYDIKSIVTKEQFEQMQYKVSD